MMLKLSSIFALGAVLMSEMKDALGMSQRFGRMQRSRATARLLLQAYAMLGRSQKLIRSLER